MMKKLLCILLCGFTFISNGAESKNALLTIYMDNTAIIKELREFKLNKGQNIIIVEQIPYNIDISTFIMKPIKYPDKVSVHKKQYNYNILDRQILLGDQVDKEVTIVVQSGESFSGNLQRVTDKEIILINEINEYIIVAADKIISFVMSSDNRNKLLKPQLIVQIDSEVEKVVPFEISYLTNKLGWKTHYVGFLHDNELELYPFALIDNKTRVSYSDANIKLISGEINKANSQQSRPGGRAFAMSLEKDAAQAPPFKEKSVFEYYSYTLDRKVNVPIRSIQEMLLLPEKKVNINKYYVYDGSRSGERVITYLNYKNSKSGGFGVPLPSGMVSIFQLEKDDFLILLGEFTMNATPVGKEVDIQTGIAFDLTGKRIQKEIKRISRTEREEVYEITVRNAKKTPAEVKVIEHLYGDWNIRESSHTYNKKDSHTVEFQLNITASSETVLLYTVRIK
ncbi:DUF4139 domain-containing protein [candidate division KSB1 bacterium]